MGGSKSVRDQKTIDGFEIKLIGKSWYDYRGLSGIEKKIWVEVRKDGELYLSNQVCVRHAHDSSEDQPDKDASSIEELRVDDDGRISVRLTGTKVDYWIATTKA